ncbi:putative Protein FdhD homolog [uncultured Desulfobacterium sp.]|uniref:Sulfur carrier protein FdhD n=1 Tax=uncultured Desulfobacterium sp. TaxID=201089 RepID=A0A445MUS2_9BACT|nr:putative Protein FdhD homolog [uncultured Desulfobacterium sp.]
MEDIIVSKSYRSYTFSEGGVSQIKADLLVEAPLEIIINGKSSVLIMFTPQNIKELVVGFVFTEGIINNLSEIEKCEICPVRNPNGEEVIEARVEISSSHARNLTAKGQRVSYSSCGICGKEGYLNLETGLSRVKSSHTFSMEVLLGLVARMKQYQPLYNNTGAAHAAMLFKSDGTPIVQCEDMGRHNALDKVIGMTLINGIPPDDKIIFSSGRASLEMIIKTARAGFPVFVAKSRPTSKAVEAAKYYNITLLDVAKSSNRVYSHARRIKGF